MKNKSFIIKMLIYAAVLITITVIMFLVFEDTIITNDIALGQMSNSDEMYLLMEYYRRVRIGVSTTYGCISTFIIGAIIYNIYNFIRKKGED